MRARDEEKEAGYRAAVPHVAAAERWVPPPRMSAFIGPRLPYVRPSELQDAVARAREIVAEADKVADDSRSICHYSARCAGSASRLRMAERSQWAGDPLRGEALALRSSLRFLSVEMHNRGQAKRFREMGFEQTPHRIEHAHD